MEKCIIVAVADNLAIGKGNDIPWHISEDLRYFKRVTSGHPVIMGRRTFESIGRPLPRRTNIVVTRGFEAPEGIIQVPTLAQAYEVAEAAVRDDEDKKCFVMGGGQLYAAAIDDADRLYVTHVHTVIEDAEAFFPPVDPEIWVLEESGEECVDPESGLRYEFVTYTRK